MSEGGCKAAARAGASASSLRGSGANCVYMVPQKEAFTLLAFHKLEELFKESNIRSFLN